MKGVCNIKTLDILRYLMLKKTGLISACLGGVYSRKKNTNIIKIIVIYKGKQLL